MKPVIISSVKLSKAIPAGVTVVAVSKTQPPGKIVEAIDADFTHFGENRIEEVEQKWTRLPQTMRRKVTLHMIGHVQSRKAARVVKLCDWVDSVDSLKLAQKLDTRAAELHKKLSVLVQVSFSKERNKFGYQPSAQFERELLAIHKLENIALRGLMTIAPLVDDPRKARLTFQKLAQLRKYLSEKYPQLNLAHLSMGMTNDYQVALEEGATMVRIGRGIFGA
ncbi:MAG: hypothetical protein UX28_C0003G0122 [Candidatus Pacebacteria bacterium GW2011_GWA1_46_10]|nr:MAG: hypothetical protein UX28_C0003G0122 [Candidatus Pacebacteria bacterium GW2011_GWA1_46_10]